MAQDLATHLSIDDIELFFNDYWPRCNRSTKTALLCELRPHLIRCANLIRQLEPQLFQTKATKEDTNSEPIAQPPVPAPAAPIPTQRRFACSRPSSRTCSPAQLLSAIQKPPPSRSSKYLPALPKAVVETLTCTSAEEFFQTKRNGTPCRELLLVLIESENDMWLSAIKRRLLTIGLFCLRQKIMRHEACSQYNYTEKGATKRIIDVAALRNPELSKKTVQTVINKHISRGKKYWGLMQALSISAVIALSPDHASHYECKLPSEENKRRRDFISELRAGGAKTTAEIVHLSKPTKQLEATALRYLDWICAEFEAWFDNKHKLNRETDTFQVQDAAANLPEPPRVTGIDNGVVSLQGGVFNLPPAISPSTAANVVDGHCEATAVPNATASIPADFAAEGGSPTECVDAASGMYGNTRAFVLHHGPLDVLANTALLHAQSQTDPSHSYADHHYATETAEATMRQGRAAITLSSSSDAASLFDSSLQPLHPLPRSSEEDGATMPSNNEQKRLYDGEEASTTKRQKSVSRPTASDLNYGVEAARAEGLNNISTDPGDGAESTHCQQRNFATTMPDLHWDWTEVLEEYSGWDWNAAISTDTSPNTENQFREEDLNFGL